MITKVAQGLGCRDLHHKAMEQYDIADSYKRSQMPGKRQQHLRRALLFETQAANKLKDETGPEVEPTRSVLYRSAASIAWQLGNYEEARRLVGIGMTPTAPIEIVREMQEILDQIDKAPGQALN